MRKLPAVVVAVLFCCSSIFAQPIKEKTKFGFKAGGNLSGFRPGAKYPEIGLDLKTGVVLGAFVHIPISKRFSLQPEFLYSQLGSKSNSIRWGYVTFRYNYFSIPLLVKYKVTHHFNVFAGAEFDNLIRARQKGSPTKTITYDVKDFDFAYTAGIGASFSRHWTFDIRYIHGTQDVSVEPNETTFYNRAVQATFGYKLNKGAKKVKKAKK
jgi:hypothetical protein